MPVAPGAAGVEALEAAVVTGIGAAGEVDAGAEVEDVPVVGATDAATEPAAAATAEADVGTEVAGGTADAPPAAEVALTAVADVPNGETASAGRAVGLRPTCSTTTTVSAIRTGMA
jgi:hypothetical protein